MSMKIIKRALAESYQYAGLTKQDITDLSDREIVRALKESTAFKKLQPSSLTQLATMVRALVVENENASACSVGSKVKSLRGGCHSGTVEKVEGNQVFFRCENTGDLMKTHISNVECAGAQSGGEGAVEEDYEEGKYGDGEDDVIANLASEYFHIDINDPNSSAQVSADAAKTALDDAFKAGKDDGGDDEEEVDENCSGAVATGAAPMGSPVKREEELEEDRESGVLPSKAQLLVNRIKERGMVDPAHIQEFDAEAVKFVNSTDPQRTSWDTIKSGLIALASAFKGPRVNESAMRKYKQINESVRRTKRKMK